MSQASKVLKEIAAGPEYSALVQAIENKDYEAIAANFQVLNESIEEKKKQILEKIDALPRQNKDEDRQQFIGAFSRLLVTNLPEWNRLNTLIREQKVAEGEVFSVGAKGDPMVRSPEGKMIIISGTPAEKGTVIRYRVTREGDKLDFGRAVEFNSDFFYSLLNSNILGKIWTSFDTIEARLKPEAGEITPAVIDEILGQLQEIRELAGSLKSEERAGISGKIMFYRKKLLLDYCQQTAADFLETKEENDIKASCNGDAQQAASALTATGLYRIDNLLAFKKEVFDGKKIKGYSDIIKNMESKLDTMEAAMELMEFKSNFEDVESSARIYGERLEILIDRLQKKIRNTAFAVAEDKVNNVEDANKSIEAALSDAALGQELSRIFRSTNDYFRLRDAATKIMVMLGNETIAASEAAVKPYLSEKLKAAFRRR